MALFHVSDLGPCCSEKLDQKDTDPADGQVQVVDCGMSSISNGAFIQSLYEAFGKGDVPFVLGSFDPNINWQEAENSNYGDRNPYTNPQEVLEGVFMRLLGDVPDFALHPAEFIDAGDTVVVEGRYKGTWKATGKAIDAQFAHVWRVRDGKVVSFQQYTDTLQWKDVETP